MRLLKTNRDVRKLKWQYKVKNMPEQRLPAIVDNAAWEKITKGRAGIRWDNVVEKIWKDTGEDQEEVMSLEKFGGYKTEVKERIEETERQALRNKVKEKYVKIRPRKACRYPNLRSFGWVSYDKVGGLYSGKLGIRSEARASDLRSYPGLWWKRIKLHLYEGTKVSTPRTYPIGRPAGGTLCPPPINFTST